MTPPTHHRGRCPICRVLCEQTRTMATIDGTSSVSALTCNECGASYRAGGCCRCGSDAVLHRVVRDPSGAELPVTDCPDCESLCLQTRVATHEERVESERNRALEEKATLLSASLRQSDDVIAAQARQLREADVARTALREQLLLTERRASSRPPPPDEEASSKADAVVRKHGMLTMRDGIAAVVQEVISERNADRVRLEALLAEVDAWGAERVQESERSGLTEILARYKEVP